RFLARSPGRCPREPCLAQSARSEIRIRRRSLMQRLNVGMIGGGFMAKAHALAYAAMPMFFWPAPAIPVRHTVADVTDELASDAANRFGFSRGVSDWRRVIDDPEINIIDIVTPNNTHPEIAIAAAQ